MHFSDTAIHVFNVFADQCATDSRTMAVQKFCGAVKNIIHTILKRLLQVWCCKSIINRYN